MAGACCGRIVRLCQGDVGGGLRHPIEERADIFREPLAVHGIVEQGVARLRGHLVRDAVCGLACGGEDRELRLEGLARLCATLRPIEELLSLLVRPGDGLLLHGALSTLVRLLHHGGDVLDGLLDHRGDGPSSGIIKGSNGERGHGADKLFHAILRDFDVLLFG